MLVSQQLSARHDVVFPQEKVVILGGGNMGRAFSTILVGNKLLQPDNVTIVGKESRKAEALAKELGCRAALGDYRAVNDATLVLVACKAKDFYVALVAIEPHLRADVMLVSTVPGKGFDTFREVIGQKGKISIIIPNPAFEFGRSLSIVLQEPSNSHGGSQDRGIGHQLVSALYAGGGSVFYASAQDRRSLPTASAISGCGPAFVADFVGRLHNEYGIEIDQCDSELRSYLKSVGAPVEPGIRGVGDIVASFHWLGSEAITAGMSCGFTYQEAERLWLGAIDGYLAMRERDISPETIISRVATPGGTTEAALFQWQEGYSEEPSPSIRRIICFAARRMGSPG